MKFPETLQYYRKKIGLTQEEMAKKLGIGRSTMGMYESGRREPNFDMLFRMARVLDVLVSDLLGDVEKGTKEENDAELAALLDDLKNREDMRMLFRLAHDASPDDVKAAVKIIEALRRE